MGSLLKKLSIDGFILSLLVAVLVAAVLPATGRAVPVTDSVVVAAIALLFFLYGARIHPREALEGLKHWRLHTTILAFTFVLFPIIGVGMRFLPSFALDSSLYLGLLFMTLVPSTVQSSIAFTSIAHGNVPGAIVSASASNLLGVFVTPLLVVTLMTTSGQVHFDAASLIDICLQLLLPFIVGQLARPWIGEWVARKAGTLKYVDRTSIVLVVYAAFSQGTREGLWAKVSALSIVQLIVLSVVLVTIMLWLTRFAAQRFGLNRADAIAVQFCGSKKSLATGVPMAAVLFAGQDIGLMVLPLMVFHQVQLMLCAWLAGRYSRVNPQPAHA